MLHNFFDQPEILPLAHRSIQPETGGRLELEILVILNIVLFIEIVLLNISDLKISYFDTKS